MGKRQHPDTVALSPEMLADLNQPVSGLPEKRFRGYKKKTPTLSNTEKKRRDRKRNYLQSKHQKQGIRAHLMQSIQDHSRLSEEVKAVLIPSCELGQVPTMKVRLSRELKRRKLGIAPDEDVRLLMEVESESPEPEVNKRPCISTSLQSKSVEVKNYLSEEESSDPNLEEWNQSSGEEDVQHGVNPQSLDFAVLAGLKSGVDSSTPELKKLYITVTRSTAIQTARLELPILSMEREVTEAIQDHPFTIVCGATGSGKSTQVPQFLYELGYGHHDSPFPGKIGITQPRRVAAMTLAQRVAEELGVRFGEEVGYQIRFDSHTIDAEKNRIKFMTDGILLKEVETDFLLGQYSVLIIDEAHERSVNTDILLGLLARIVPLREKLSKDMEAKDKVLPLKVVIMSATLRIDDFVSNPRLFPSPPPVVNVESRQYPVAIHYAKVTDREEYLDLAFRKVVKIHRNLPPGGILVFLTGRRDVEHLRTKLKYELRTESAVVLALYSMLSPQKQLKVFNSYPNKRLIVVATNIAETSLTIPTVKYVIDCGLEKRKVFAGKLQMSAFVVDWISKSSADQRAGRAGRVSPGHCYRLYTLAAYNNCFQAFRPPQILAFPIEGTLLLLKAMGIRDVTKFPFPTSPSDSSIQTALDQLMMLGAVTKKRVNTNSVDGCQVTDIGKEMAGLPIAPRYSKMLVLAKHTDVLKLVVITAASLSVDQVFQDEVTDEDGKRSKVAAKRLHAKWQSSQSDALGLLHLAATYFNLRQCASAKSQFEEDFCLEHHVHLKSMREIGELACQLLSALEGSQHVTLETHFGDISPPTEIQYQSVLKCVVGGFIDRVAMADPDPTDTWKESKRIPYLTSEHLDTSLYTDEYKALNPEKEYTFIHPSSYLFGRSSPSLIVYQDLIFTSRPYMKCITAVRPEWLLELGSHLIPQSSPLQSPSPVCENGVLKCWIEPAFGPKCWKLPMQLVSYPEDEGLIYCWLLRFLVEGTLVPELNDCKTLWNIKPANITNPQASGTQRTIAKAVFLMKSKHIVSRFGLSAASSKTLKALQKALEPLVKPQVLGQFESCWNRVFPGSG